MQRTDFVSGVPWFSSKPERAIFDSQQFACVCAVGPLGGRPLRIAKTRNLKERMQALQIGNWQELTIHHVEWTLGDALADRLLQDVVNLVGKRKILADWYDVTAELGANAIRIAAERQPVPTFSHTEMLAKVRQIRKEKIEAAVRGV